MSITNSTNEHTETNAVQTWRGPFCECSICKITKEFSKYKAQMSEGYEEIKTNA